MNLHSQNLRDACDLLSDARVWRASEILLISSVDVLGGKTGKLKYEFCI